VHPRDRKVGNGTQRDPGDDDLAVRLHQHGGRLVETEA
jgi:hypothetical protein